MSIVGRIAARLPPDSKATNAVHRGVLAGGSVVAGLRGGDRASAAIARAMRTTAMGRFSAEEREWIQRIEARRIRMASEFTVPGADAPQPLDPDKPDLWAPPFRWSMPRVWARFLMRLVAELRPDSCVEMGVGFGISAMYQASALEMRGAGRLLTLDQEQSLIAVATRGFRELGLDERITLETGPIGATAAAAAASAAPIDYALIDAEHTEEATVFNFDALRPHLAPGAVVVVDDIFMDDPMRRAWRTIQARQGNARTLTLRRLGIVIADGAV